MAKAKEPARETFVDTAQDNDFGDPEIVSDGEALPPRGAELQGDIEAIRAQRAAQRKARGAGGRKRVIRHYHDAERLRNLGLLTAEEHVDCEEGGLFPDPTHYATGSSALGLPPDEGV